MDNENKYSVTDLVRFAGEQKPVEFNDAFSSLVTDRIASVVDNRKMQIASSMFNNVHDGEINDESDTEELEVEEEDSDGEAA